MRVWQVCWSGLASLLVITRMIGSHTPIEVGCPRPVKDSIGIKTGNYMVTQARKSGSTQHDKAGTTSTGRRQETDDQLPAAQDDDKESQ